MTCVPWSLDQGCCPDWATFAPESQARAEELAWETLRILTGGLVGNCPAVFRPCVDVPCNACSSAWVTVNGMPLRGVCGGNSCSCPALSEIVLAGQVAEITEIVEDGNTLPITSYRLDGNRIVRTDGGTWPACQDMTLSEDAVGALAVRYVSGRIPGASGEFAAGILACEFAKACETGKCRLPASVVSITRQGVSMQMAQGMFPNGLTGIREVDAYVKTVNPNTLVMPPTVWSPDIASGRYTGVTSP